MRKISRHGYTRLASSPTILTAGPSGSCRTPTTELIEWRPNQVFARAWELAEQVRTIPTQDGGSGSLTKLVPGETLLGGHCKANLKFYKIVLNTVP